MREINIVVAQQNDELFSEIMNFLKNEEDIVVKGRATDQFSAKKLVDLFKPDIILTDIDLHGKGDKVGIDMAITCKLVHPETKIIFVTENINESCIRNTVGLGIAVNYLPKNHLVHLADVIRRAFKGNYDLEKGVQGILLKDYKKSLKNTMVKLTKHHLFVLKLFYDGYTVQEVSNRLNVEIQSVRNLQQEIIKRCSDWEWGEKNLTIHDIANRAKLLGLLND